MHASSEASKADAYEIILLEAVKKSKVAKKVLKSVILMWG